jgi:hypothetical protein
MLALLFEQAYKWVDKHYQSCREAREGMHEVEMLYGCSGIGGRVGVGR